MMARLRTRWLMELKTAHDCFATIAEEEVCAVAIALDVIADRVVIRVERNA